jgi:ribosome recycling factor
MLSIEKTKELLDDKTISDDQAEKIRDDVQTLAEIIIEKYISDKKSGKWKN